MERLYTRQLALGPMQNFVYLFGAKEAEEVAVVDPAWNVDAIVRAAEEDGKRITRILLTHHHHDHINGVAPLLERQPELRVVAQEQEIAFSPALQAFGAALEAVRPDAEIELGPLSIRCMHTPGHTPGAHCFYVEGALFSGDTLFVQGCGRCDLAGSDPAQMYESLHQVIGSLPDETLVYPGHDYGPSPVSTLGAEKRENPYFQRRDREAFIQYRMRPR